MQSTEVFFFYSFRSEPFQSDPCVRDGTGGWVLRVELSENIFHGVRFLWVVPFVGVGEAGSAEKVGGNVETSMTTNGGDKVAHADTCPRTCTFLHCTCTG